VIKSNRNKRDEATKMRFFFSRITIFGSCQSEKCGMLVKQDEMKNEKRKYVHSFFVRIGSNISGILSR
jgi:hypothetical protein